MFSNAIVACTRELEKIAIPLVAKLQPGSMLYQIIDNRFSDTNRARCSHINAPGQRRVTSVIFLIYVETAFDTLSYILQTLAVSCVMQLCHSPLSRARGD